MVSGLFKEIGWVDELRSGVRNITKYNKIYSGSEPMFIEGDIFKTIIPLTARITEQVADEIKRLLEFFSVPRTRSEVQEFLNLHHREYFRTKILNPLIKGGLLKLTIPEKATSSKQKYYRNR